MIKSETIVLPQKLDLENLCKFSCQLHNVPSAKEYIFDFGEKRWFPPFAMLFLSMQLNAFRKARPSAKKRAHNHKNHPYAAHMGFFNAFGLGYGLNPGEAPGSERYVPITSLSVKKIVKTANRACVHVGDVVEKKSQEMAALLCRSKEGDLFQALSYSVREMVRNVVEHSEASELFVVGQNACTCKTTWARVQYFSPRH